ncbi:hypothetical protein RI844_11670 [Thalassotalea fonticola]|uniref:Uncharacterized protein n=1 Tax=Thalassotalea fonticola TaxID=3065649 RepID=A0ABZ0GJI3_9GAMM|nr:hypothetical protein RI844_11670 [Colwelliaceae bacterium S1-1]
MENIPPYLLKAWIQTYIKFHQHKASCHVEKLILEHCGSIEAAYEQHQINLDNNLVEW